MSQQANAILGLLAQTSIHAGAGTSVGAIDLPIQREGHNGWPCVYGSAVKGALRSKAEDVLSDDSLIFAIFGPDTRNASEHAGALAVGDARLLLLPVRSLTSAYKWVTCPAALNRLARDMALLGLNVTFETPPVSSENAAITPNLAGSLFLEEYRFEAEQSDLDELTTALASLMNRAKAKDALSRQLVLVSDDMFAHLAQYATPVMAHIALKDDASKTVEDGALWYEETLPPETLLYVPLMAQSSRRRAKELTAAEVREAVINLFEPHSWLQVGGNETVGMGWCAVQKVLGA